MRKIFGCVEFILVVWKLCCCFLNSVATVKLGIQHRKLKSHIPNVQSYAENVVNLASTAQQAATSSEQCEFGQKTTKEP